MPPDNNLHISKLVFLFIVENMCCVYLNEPPQSNGSFGHPKHMLKMMDKTKNHNFTLKQVVYIDLHYYEFQL